MTGTLALTLLLLFAGCATRVPVPRGPMPDRAEAERAWTRVLATRVDRFGRVDFRGLAEQPDDLELYLRYLGEAGPRRRPADYPRFEDRLAYYLNAYNALAMYGILRQKIPRDLNDAAARARFFRRQAFALDGHARSLDALETEVLRPLEDPRVPFALNRMTASSPQLPPEPFRGDDLDRQLDAEVQRFFAEERNLRVDGAGQVVRVSAALQDSEWEFTRAAGSLVAYVNRYRAGAPLPAGSRIEYIPYDWTVRSQWRLCREMPGPALLRS